MCGDSLGGGGSNIVLAIDPVGEVRGAAHSVCTAVMTDLSQNVISARVETFCINGLHLTWHV